jgi:hypothetical protein
MPTTPLPLQKKKKKKSSPLIEKERCFERKRDTEIVRENPNYSWVTACGIRNGLTFLLKG